MATKKEKQEQEALERSKVGGLTEDNLALQNRLLLSREINKAKKEELSLTNQIKELGRKALIDANKYSRTTQEIKNLEKELADSKHAAAVATTNAEKKRYNDAVKFTEAAIAAEKKKADQYKRTAGGALRAMQEEAGKRRSALETEKKLIQDINRQRAESNKLGRVGVAIADLFRSKEQRQLEINRARARAGGGVNVVPPGGGTGGGTVATGAAGGGAGGNGNNKTGWLAALAGMGIVGAILAGIITKIKTLVPAIKAIGGVLKSNMVTPLSQMTGLVSGGIGGGMGVGGGGISGTGATSILGGFQDIASKIPFIGGLLGGLIGGLKAIVDLVLGIDQGLTNFARNLGISKTQAAGIKEEFRAIAKTSDNIVVNETRLMESQVELTKALGVRSVFTRDILENSIKLKEIAGVELEVRKSIAQVSIMQGKNAEDLTKNILAQTKSFEFATGIAFEYRDVLGQASKQAGLMGLIFANNEKRLTNMLMNTRAMGYELKQLDSLASSFLDFESSISKEFEAQVLTGKEMNLTKAREAALNNDLVTLAKEINTNVGSTAEYLNMNRIQQEAIAESVGMSRDGLADVLKQQDYYSRLGATNLRQAQEELKVLKQKGLTQAEISKKIGEDAYNYITQTSTAERLTELMNRIKTIFIEFVEKSGVLDFITNPQKIQGFVAGLMDRFAGAVEMVGKLIATLVEGMARIVGFFGGDEQGMRRMAASIRSGAGTFAGGIRAAGETIGGMPTESIGNNVVQNNKPAAPTSTGTAAAGQSPQYIYVNVSMDGEPIYRRVTLNQPNQHSATIK